MTFFQEFDADKSLYFVPIRRIHNDSMYVIFCGIRNIKIWSKSILGLDYS